ncbi:MAG: toxin-activating lysine-acyltransferase [Rhodovulum sulfidophilum]|uniref:Toxin-activating lysine-acyltransferase n=1 Tax=Rhodovulum sulfidophilum TaxID=35806 RepID=A0A2W5N0I2_RHOSU|nr:MAG: toxin-activating lysine-acyltransferase [Rhodovulum sulfidophilum]
MSTVSPRPAAPPRAEEAAPRLVTGLPPDVALGRAVAHLMIRPAFAAAPFGHVARGLTGQVNRGDYAFVARGARFVGFAGWARASEARAEAWLAGTRALAEAEAREGDCLVLNFWQADDPAVSRFLVAALGARMPDIRLVVARRHYPDGRIRPLRLRRPARGRDASEFIFAKEHFS